MNFDWEQYIENYADLKAAGINTQQKALQHYNRYGKRENRIDKIVNFNFIISGEKIQLKCDYFIGSIWIRMCNRSQKKPYIWHPYFWI